MQNNSVSGNTGPGTVYGPSDEMYVSEEMIQQCERDCRNDRSLTRHFS